jgi:hypothetical protein
MLVHTALLLASVSSPPTPGQALLVGRPAPVIAARTWLESASGQGESRREARSDGSLRGGLGFLGGEAASGGHDLDELHGHVVLVHALGWEEDEEVAPLVLDLARANVDRALVVRSIAPERDQEAATERLRGWGVDWPVALVAEDSESVWAQWALASPGDVALVGRGGELAWIGMLDDQKSLLKAVEELLLRPVVPALDAPSHAGLQKALEEYWSGRLAKAATLAEAAAKGSKDEELRDAAQALVGAVAEAESSWPRELAAARQGVDELRYLRLLAAIELAFPRGDAAATAEEIDQQARRDPFFPGRLHDGEAFLALLADRPVLFPVRKDAKGDAYAKKLDKLLRATNNDIPSTQAARSLLDRYRAAR